ncbi:alkyl/aryl-sulfatase [Aquiflexum gelatinilyticum]|uniref:alkyl/aryl-sulfatase n=1 Tax=Aquiflexum gelatinilyticum TaxID=2961943 RepID=UPI002167A9C1|nr:alkyl sulfatase dimerization domain-containing protein [Aquiflexum gelatinilyticum]MCS4436295.1 MBL fold metallo-hydrolase [Aquiflexum gelatinilyticum]
MKFTNTNSVFKSLLTLFLMVLLFSQLSCSNQNTESSGDDLSVADHFDPKGKAPSKHTLAIWENWKKTLPFEDKRDYEEAQKGFIAAPDFRQIKNAEGRVIWDIGRYDFLLKEQDYQTIHPSLQRIATLNMGYGLFKVTDGIYQVRGFDLSNMTLIEGKTGWILYDVLTTKETAAAALKFANEQLGERPVTAVIYSHTHADHFGGVRGVINEEDVIAGKVKVIAPAGFMDFAVSENVIAGNAMNRRLFYQYGVLLPVSPYGHVDQALSKNVSSGSLGLIAPTISISKPIEELVVDGVKMIFQNTPNTEAPVEMNTYIPEKKALWMAENVTATIHNIYTLRGALVRDALTWSKKISEALYMFGEEADVMFASHHWPRWGNERVQEVLRAQRDTYGHIHNTVLNLANQGVTVNEVHNVYEVPASLQKQWSARSYHGSVEHNSRAIINRYLGYWDANPLTLIPMPERESAPLFVEMMGGAGPIIEKGKELFEEGKYKPAAELLNKLVFAEPQNQEAKDLLADCYEQIGYQQESTSVRNSFLAGAYELRNGIPGGEMPKSVTPDIIRAMSTETWLDFLGVKLNSKKAEGITFKMNIITPDNNEKFLVELSNSTLSNLKGFTAKNADLTLTLNRSDLNMAMMGVKSFEDLLKEGKAKVEGNPQILAQLVGMLDEFDPRFEILPGTKKEKYQSQSADGGFDAPAYIED